MASSQPSSEEVSKVIYYLVWNTKSGTPSGRPYSRVSDAKRLITRASPTRREYLTIVELVPR